ncbi:MAG: hypothetical protein IJT88_06230 [Kiritimatiellae bacterium]|nr:hypothetical protein [Kiritimatiellia bacterium]
MKFDCPHCQQSLEADDSFAGAAVDCPMCGQSLVIPAPPTAEEPQLPDPAPSEPAPEPPVEEAEPAPEATDAPGVEELPPPPPPPPPKTPPKFRVVSKPEPASPASGTSRVASAPQVRGSQKKMECPHCFSLYEVPETVMGMYVDCPSCGKRFRARATPATGTLAGEAAGGAKLPMLLPLVIKSVMLGVIAFSTVFSYVSGFADSVYVTGPLVLVLGILSLVTGAILHYKCWEAMPVDFARTTPAKALGYLFIPFFNLYWRFPSIGGLGGDCGAFALNKGRNDFNHLGALGLTLAILMCLESTNWVWTFFSAERGIRVAWGMGWTDRAFWQCCFLLSIGGKTIIGLLLYAAKFVIWLLFYRDVTRLLNGQAAQTAISSLH